MRPPFIRSGVSSPSARNIVGLGSGSIIDPFGVGVSSPVLAGSPIPPIPAFDNVDGCWALFNWNPVGYAEDICIDGTMDGTSLFLGTEPYENNWASLSSGDQDSGWWYDSSSNGNSLRPRPTAPTIDVSNKQLVFTASGGFRSGAVSSSTTKTFYILCRIDDLGVDQVLLECGDISATAGAFRIDLNAGNLRARFNIDGFVTATVSKAMPDTGWHLVCVTLDSENATVADQFNIFIDNEEGSANATDLADVATISDLVYVGGDSFETWSFDGKMRMIRINNQVDSPAERAAMYARVQYLQGLV